MARTGLSSRADLVIYVLPTSHMDAFAMGGLFVMARCFWGPWAFVGYMVVKKPTQGSALDGAGEVLRLIWPG
jgi:hypothetical protein